MYGSQPTAAHRLAQLPEHLADGGLVARMKSADAGPATFGSRGLSQLRDMIPKMQAMGFQPQAPAPAPTTNDRGAAGVLAMIPRMEAMGFKQASAPQQQPQYFAEGGMVRGPGTGTSDSIEDEVRPGTFIMPADSTEAIGPSALEKMGTVPVRLSDGEFELPPEQVMALGTAVLKMMKDVTHTPVNGHDGGQTDAEVNGARGFAPDAADRMAQMPEQLFADGGMVENDVTRVGNSYSGGNVGGSITVNGQAPAGTNSIVSTPALSPATAPTTPAVAPASPGAAPTAPGVAQASAVAPATTPAPPAPMGWAERNAQRNMEVTASSIMDSPERRAAQAALAPAPPPASVAAPVAAPTPTAAGFQPASQRMGTIPPLGQPALGYQPRRYADGGTVSGLADLPPGYQPRGYYDGETVVDDREQQALANQTAMYVRGAQEAAATPAPAPAPTPVAAPAQPAGALTRAAGAGRGFSNPASVTPAPAVEAMSGGLGFQPNAVTRTGNSYTGPANISGDVTINGGAPRNGGQISVQNMGAADGLARRSAVDAMANMPNAPAPVQAPTVRHSGNDWASRKALENAATAASSITANGGRFDETRGRNPASLAYQAAIANDNAQRAAEPAAGLAAMQEASANNRAAMQQRSAAAQALASERGAMDRTLITERGNNTRAGITALASTEAARLKAQQEGKAPAGYRYTAGGGMEAIPGGPADQKQSKEGVQQGKDTQDIFSILNEARPLMDNATGSYAGVAADKAAQTVGIATDGAKATAQLKALQGALVSKMPKMSGPQSDKDVQLYREMAGQIGDPTIPVEQRKAAMGTIENLNMKYLPAVADAAGYQAVPSGAYYKTAAGDVRRKQ